MLRPYPQGGCLLQPRASAPRLIPPKNDAQACNSWSRKFRLNFRTILELDLIAVIKAFNSNGVAS